MPVNNAIDRRSFIRLGIGAGLGLACGGALLGLGCDGNRYSKQDGRLRIRLGYLPITDHLLVLAHRLHQFQHLEIVPIKFASWPEAAEALRAGAVDAAFLLTPLGLALRRQSVPIKAVLLGHRNGSALTVANSDAIASPAQLAGKRIAIPSRFSTHYLLLRHLLSQNGIALDRLRLVDMAPPEMVQALSSAQVDGFIVAEPFGAQAELQGVGRVLVLSGDIWPGHICCVLNLQEELIQSYPDACQELVDGLISSGRRIETDRSAAAAISLDYLGQAQAVIDYVLHNPPERVRYTELTPLLADFAASREKMVQVGQKEVEKLNLEQYIEPGFALGAEARGENLLSLPKV